MRILSRKTDKQTCRSRLGSVCGNRSNVEKNELSSLSTVIHNNKPHAAGNSEMLYSPGLRSVPTVGGSSELFQKAASFAARVAAGKIHFAVSNRNGNKLLIFIHICCYCFFVGRSVISSAGGNWKKLRLAAILEVCSVAHIVLRIGTAEVVITPKCNI